MRNTQMNFVVYGCSFGSIHLYYLHERIYQKSQNNLKQNNIRTCLTIFHSQKRTSAFVPTVRRYMFVSNRGMSEWLSFKAKWAICQTRTSYILLRSWCLFYTRLPRSVEIVLCISLQWDTLYWFLNNQSLLLLLSMYVQWRSSRYQTILRETIGDRKHVLLHSN